MEIKEYRWCLIYMILNVSGVIRRCCKFLYPYTVYIFTSCLVNMNKVMYQQTRYYVTADVVHSFADTAYVNILTGHSNI